MTGRALLVFVSARTLAATAALLLLAAVLASCGDAQEEVGPDVQPSATVSSSSSASPVPLTATPAATSTEPPVGWVQYTNKDLGFSLSHPARLIPKDVSSTSGPNRQWALDFRDPDDRSSAMAVAVVDNVGELSVREWAQTYSMCNLEVRPGTDVTIGGRPGVLCVGEPLDEQFDYEAVIKDGSRIIYVSTTLAEADFALIAGSIRFAN